MKRLSVITLLLLLNISCAMTPKQQREDQIAREQKYRPEVQKFVLTYLEENFPKSGKYWSSREFPEFKNGERMEVASYEHSSKELRISKIAKRDFIQTDGFIEFKQGVKTVKVKCHFALDGRDNKLTLSNVNYEYDKTKHENPECEYKVGDGILVEDPNKQLKFDQRTMQAIKNREVFIGMPEAAIIPSRGEMKINETNYQGMVVKQYVEDIGRYIYVKDGKVIAIQSFK